MTSHMYVYTGIRVYMNQRLSRNTATNKHTIASEEPQGVHVQLPSPCQNECQRGCSRKRRNEQTNHSCAAGPWNRKNRNKVADGREISMDCVAIPACYEPPGFDPTPWELKAGWLCTIVPRRCAIKGGKEAGRRRHHLHAWQRASNLRPPGRSTRALPVYYATDAVI